MEPCAAAELVPETALELGAWLRATLPSGAALQADSRLVRPGDAFFAYPGLRIDGRGFMADALARGAAAVVVEADGAAPLPEASVPMRACAGLRTLAGSIASAYHGRPSEGLDLIAVTGTNGKTSVSQWVARGLAEFGRRSGVIGTLGSGPVGSLEQSSGLTTPDALGLQSTLARFAASGVDSVAAEASSIGLDQGRLNGTRIAVAAFTNLSRDHLDYHGTMEAYAQAKTHLFAWPGLRAVVVNGDDPAGRLMLAATRTGPKAPQRIVYGLNPGRHGARGDRTLIAERVFEDGSGIQMTLSGDFGSADLRLRLLGLFNVSNALAAAGCWLALGHTFERVVEALERLDSVPGRMQTIQEDGAPLVVVDYAHSPDALDNVLVSLRSVAVRRGGRLWCVFGAGGDRDIGKRAQMGLVAERAADHLVITSDNPRSESPFRIVSDIRAGLIREPALTELDRAAAIHAAIARAAVADVVLVAGKGHENYQEIAGARLPFSDVEVSRAALRARREVHGV
nr:UDP-N-acetylmuramoyl-L-alanyl-D-glutamate--2,6-diaminopimelate ligase [Quisquiliibacterium transsilvanicum]